MCITLGNSHPHLAEVGLFKTNRICILFQLSLLLKPDFRLLYVAIQYSTCIFAIYSQYLYT